MLVAQVCLGVLALACALLALAVLIRAGDDQRVAVISLIVLAIFFAALMIWAQFIPIEETVVP